MAAAAVVDTRCVASGELGEVPAEVGCSVLQWGCSPKEMGRRGREGWWCWVSEAVELGCSVAGWV